MMIFCWVSYKAPVCAAGAGSEYEGEDDARWWGHGAGADGGRSRTLHRRLGVAMPRASQKGAPAASPTISTLFSPRPVLLLTAHPAPSGRSHIPTGPYRSTHTSVESSVEAGNIGVRRRQVSAAVHWSCDTHLLFSFRHISTRPCTPPRLFVGTLSPKPPLVCYRPPPPYSYVPAAVVGIICLSGKTFLQTTEHVRRRHAPTRTVYTRCVFHSSSVCRPSATSSRSGAVHPPNHLKGPGRGDGRPGHRGPCTFPSKLSATQ